MKKPQTNQQGPEIITKKKAVIKMITITPHTPEWYQFRYDNGYGSSEVPTVVAADNPLLAPYVWESPVQMHLGKIGEPILPFQGNAASEDGHLMEPMILRKYRCLNQKTMDLMDMYKRARMKKPEYYHRVLQLKRFVVNSKFPWLYASPDGFGYTKILEKWKNNYGVESKNTNDLEANKYPNKVSPSFMIQVWTQLLITGWEYTDIALNLDRGNFDIIRVMPKREAFEHILESTYKWWRNVLEARRIKLQYNIDQYYNQRIEYFTPAQQQAIGTLQSLEPELVGTQKELEFIRDSIKAEKEIMSRPATPEDTERITIYHNILRQMKDIEAKLNMAQARLISGMGGYNKVFWEQETDGKYYSFLANVDGIKKVYVSPKLFND